jgi:hypothetical protein
MKHKHDSLEKLYTQLCNGETRHKLPGRGITIKRYHRLPNYDCYTIASLETIRILQDMFPTTYRKEN